MTALRGRRVSLRPVTPDDEPKLAAIRATPQVRARWCDDDEPDSDAERLVIEADGVVRGMIQWAQESDPMYRHAGIDIYLDPAVHGRGLGTDAVRTLARHLIEAHGHHRLVIDPAADNLAAIACYSKVGFKPVGVMRRYERGPDGTWHDGLLMDLLAEELT